MLVLGGIVLLHITTIILLLVATIDNAWWFTDTVSTDIWGRWELTGSSWHYANMKGGYPEEYMQAVQASTVLACIFSILSLFVFMAQLFTLGKGQRFTFSGALQLISSLCIMIAASIYTAQFHLQEREDGRGWYGHSYILAWISFVFSFFLGMVYVVLRKKSE